MIHQRQRLPFGSNRAITCRRVHPGLDDLERHLALDRLDLLGHIDQSKAAFPNLLQQLISPDPQPGPSSTLSLSTSTLIVLRSSTLHSGLWTSDSQTRPWPCTGHKARPLRPGHVPAAFRACSRISHNASSKRTSPTTDPKAAGDYRQTVISNPVISNQYSVFSIQYSVFSHERRLPRLITDPWSLITDHQSASTQRRQQRRISSSIPPGRRLCGRLPRAPVPVTVPQSCTAVVTAPGRHVQLGAASARNRPRQRHPPGSLSKGT